MAVRQGGHCRPEIFLSSGRVGVFEQQGDSERATFVCAPLQEFGDTLISNRIPNRREADSKTNESARVGVYLFHLPLHLRCAHICVGVSVYLSESVYAY